MTTLSYRYFLPIIYIYAFLALLFAFSSFSASAHGNEAHPFIETLEKQKETIQECLSLSGASQGEDVCYFTLCEGQSPYLCAEDILDTVVFLAGPEKAMPVLSGIMESSLFSIQTDGHQLAHRIGNATSHHYGLSGESFLRCPIDFNYGCQHGFFEDALEKHKDPAKAATEICESIPDRPYKNKFYCYHGVGHGFMFHESYHLMNSLNLCDSLPSSTSQQGCWQGVFMENINGFFSNIEGELGFIDTDVLAPCNRIENKYRHHCYENHAGYLVHHYNNSIKDASHGCLDAGDHISSCITSLGLMVTNPGWQEVLQESFNGTFTEIAVHLCDQFPPDYSEVCQSAAISNLFNFDNTDIRRSVDLCLSFQSDTERCFRTIGSLLVNIATNDDEIMKSCEMAPEEYQDECIAGGQNTLQRKPMEAKQQEYETDSKTSSSPMLYLFIGLGCALLVILLYTIFTAQKKKR